MDFLQQREVLLCPRYSVWKGRMFSGHVGKPVGNVIHLVCPVAWANEGLQESRLSNFLTCR